MGYNETAFWESDPDAPTRRDRMSGEYHPYVPDCLAKRELYLSSDAAATCEEAAVTLTELEGRARYTASVESLARVLLRSEALSSSRIEGLQMNARRLLEVEALDELGVEHRLDSTEVEVLGNVRAMQEVVTRLAEKDVIELEDILSIHAALLSQTKLASFGGCFRTTQNWIGGSWYNPLGAAYVPPKYERVPELMNDLVQFVNRDDLPTIALAALAHAQMKTIHPFVDGNGRAGRALVHVILRQRGLNGHTVVPLSPVLLTMQQQYVGALEAYRYDKQAQQTKSQNEVLSEWIEFFGFAVIKACEHALSLEEKIDALRARWQESVRPRSGSATELLLDALPGNPVVSIASVARITERSYPAARGAVRELESRGILVQSSKNKKSGLYTANDVLDEFVRYERSLATPSGDTRIEKPVRPVPQRMRKRMGGNA